MSVTDTVMPRPRSKNVTVTRHTSKQKPVLILQLVGLERKVRESYARLLHRGL